LKELKTEKKEELQPLKNDSFKNNVESKNIIEEPARINSNEEKVNDIKIKESL
jgi:hypothetical protein